MAIRNQDHIKSLESDFLRLGEENTIGNTINLFRGMLGLVGLWPMMPVQRSTGNVYDFSLQGRNLGYNGSPTFELHNSLVPYVNLNGSTDWLHRGDEADIDISGTETVIASSLRGLTMGGWFWFDSAGFGNTQACIAKGNPTVNQRSYFLDKNGGSHEAAFTISSDGTATNSAYVQSTDILVADTWYWMVGRFTPSVEMAVWVNDSKTIDTSFLVASIFNSPDEMRIGAYSNGTTIMDGRAALCFLAFAAWPDKMIRSLYYRTKRLFGHL